MGSQPLRSEVAERRPAMGWLLTSPVFILSVVALGVNDQLLKREWPGLVTGKLSDVAGVAMVAMLVAWATRRPGASCIAVAVAFSLLKTVPVVAGLAVPVLGGRTLTDPTDLVVLVVLVPVWRWMRRVPSAPRGTPLSGALNTAVAMAKVIGVGVAVVATSATSCSEVGTMGLAVTPDGVIVQTDFEYFISGDGGRTWEPRDRSLDGNLTFGFERTACAGEQCYELVENGIVGVVGDETTPEFLVTDEQLSNLVGNFVDSCSFDNSVFAHIAATEGPDGPNVVVSMGEYGVLHRAADGEWTWRDVERWGYDDQLDTDPGAGRISGAVLVTLTLIGAGATAIVGVAAGVASGRRRHGGGWAAAQVGAGLGAAIAIPTTMFTAALVSNVGGPRGASYAMLTFIVVPMAAVALLCALVQAFAPSKQQSVATPNRAL